MIEVILPLKLQVHFDAMPRIAKNLDRLRF